MKNRRGSALLIVLGFLSFMVVSAVAFSIWMRSERVPSAVFRREAVLRHLAKAGLARAMSEIDDAIRSDPYPGVVKTSYRNAYGLEMNNWSGRLFSPPDPDDASCQYYCAPRSETVAVANLEALGYLPPFLMNDVRLRQQGLWTSKWRYLDHGAGRCAYVAVNVSDLIDINRTPIDQARTSSRPITLANLFLDTNGKMNTSAVGSFADFAESPKNQDSYGNKVAAGTPFVSLLDYNLALFGAGKVGDFESPFAKWLSSGYTSSRGFYDGFDRGSDDDFPYVRQQRFVTDSYFPTSPSEEEASQPSLAVQEGDRKKRGQPFDLNVFNDLTQQKDVETLFLAQFPDAKSENVNFEDMMSIPDCVALYDYLDRDDIPTSLAWPTVERNPMVVGITAPANLTFAVTPQTFATPNVSNPEILTDVPLDLNQSITPLANAGVDVILAYPFKQNEINGANLASRSYTVEAVAKIFLVKDNGGVPVGTRTSATWSNPMFRPANADYAGDSSANDSVITLVANPKNISFSGTDDLAKRISLDFKTLSTPPAFITQVAKFISANNPADPSAGSVDIKWFASFKPYDNSFSLDNSVPTDKDAAQASLPTDGYLPVFAIWVRVRDQSGTYVADCVPATFMDDVDFNGSALNKNKDMAATEGRTSEREPLLRFTGNTGSGVRYSDAVTWATSPGTTTTQWDNNQKSLWAVDPRYNFAPEDWCRSTQPMTADDWENWATAASQADGCDGDPYLFVSNQGYLQSMGEFAFLPRVKNRFCNDMGNPSARLQGLYNSGFNDNAASASDIAAKELVWRTYCPWDEDDALFNCGISEAASGTRVSPYADADTLKLALANTPVNWWAAAGTNTVLNANRGQNPYDTVDKRGSYFRDIADSIKFAFNEEGSASSEDRLLKARDGDDDLSRLANRMHELFVNADKSLTWQQEYDSWDWTPNGTPFDTMSSTFRDQLDSVDCKYLHSFWRNCFANRQQLFIVFVRAESMALGGTGEGNVPPQQGVRAVAVVWRDPEAFVDREGTDSGTPESRASHRMRVLFYHQFE